MASFFLLDGEGSLRSHNDFSDVLILRNCSFEDCRNQYELILEL